MAGFIERVSGKFKMRLVNLISDITGVLPIANYVDIYTVIFGFIPTTAFNPVDATTYYIGGLSSAAPPTTAGTSRRRAIPVKGNITGLTLVMGNGSVSSAEANTLVIANITQSTTATVTSVWQITGQNIQNFTGFSLTCNAGDIIELRWTTPTWVTNPTTVNMQGEYIITRT